MAFEGYYIKFGTSKFPNKFLLKGSYSCTPNKKVTISSYVDANRKEHEDNAEATKTEISIITQDYLTTKDKNEIIACLNMGVTSTIEKLYKVTYWNPLKDAYDTITAKMDDLDFAVVGKNSDGPLYGAIEIKLTQNVG